MAHLVVRSYSGLWRPGQRVNYLLTVAPDESEDDQTHCLKDGQP